jgi:hypothetical protein
MGKKKLSAVLLSIVFVVALLGYIHHAEVPPCLISLVQFAGRVL